MPAKDPPPLETKFSKRKRCHPCSAPQTGGSCIKTVFHIVSAIKNRLSQDIFLADPRIRVYAIISQSAELLPTDLPNPMHDISICAGSKQYHIPDSYRMFQRCNRNRILPLTNQRHHAAAIQTNRNRGHRAIFCQCAPLRDSNRAYLFAVGHVNSPPKVTNSFAYVASVWSVSHWYAASIFTGLFMQSCASDAIASTAPSFSRYSVNLRSQ